MSNHTKRSKWRKRVWVTKDDKKLQLWQMETTHLWNACALLEKHGMEIKSLVVQLEAVYKKNYSLRRLRGTKILLSKIQLIVEWRSLFLKELSVRGAEEVFHEHFSPINENRDD